MVGLLDREKTMKSKTVTVTRIYLLEGEVKSNEIVDMLRDKLAISGVTVYRAIEGYGDDHELHTTSLLVLSLSLPMIVEFFDEPEKVESAIIALQSKFDLPHIVSWSATEYVRSES